MRARWLLLPVALLFAAQLRADTITLKTGETISGTIKSETDTDVTIDITVSSSITDERVIEKSDIASMNRATPDQIAYEQLSQIQPSSQYSYPAATYTQILSSLRDFETQYPTSAYLPAVKSLEAQFEAEQQKVNAGNVKYLGDWYTADQAQPLQNQIAALPVYDAMQQQATSGDLVGAMQTFTEIERNYATTRIYPPAVTLAQAVVGQLRETLAVRMQEVKADAAQLQVTLKFTTGPDKVNLLAQAKALQDRNAAIVGDAIRAGEKWPPLIPGSLVSIQTLQKVADTEAGRLASVPVGAMTLSLQKVDAARTEINQGELTDAEALLKDATTLWVQNDAARYWFGRLAEEVKKLETPTPTPTPKASPKPKPSASAATAAAALKPVAATPTPQMVNIILPSTPAPASDSDSKPFLMTIPGALSVLAGVLVLGGIIAVVNQRKARQQQYTE
jgi:hypothetical protein